MLSRIFWISVAGIALVAGMVVQGDSIFGWHDRAHEIRDSHRADSQIDRIIDRSFDKMEVTDAEGRKVEVSAETKRDLAGAVSRLVKAETDLALARMGDDDQQEMSSARDRIADARADIERLKTQIKSAELAARVEHDAVREEIRREIQEDVRASVREAVRN